MKKIYIPLYILTLFGSINTAPRSYKIMQSSHSQLYLDENPSIGSWVHHEWDHAKHDVGTVLHGAKKNLGKAIHDAGVGLGDVVNIGGKLYKLVKDPNCPRDDPSGQNPGDGSKWNNWNETCPNGDQYECSLVDGPNLCIKE